MSGTRTGRKDPISLRLFRVSREQYRHGVARTLDLLELVPSKSDLTLIINHDPFDPQDPIRTLIRPVPPFPLKVLRELSYSPRPRTHSPNVLPPLPLPAIPLWGPIFPILRSIHPYRRRPGCFSVSIPVSTVFLGPPLTTSDHPLYLLSYPNSTR